MKFFLDTVAVAFLLLSSTPAIAHPQPITDIQLVSESTFDAREIADTGDLWKRKGGGGKGGKGGDSSSSSSSSSGSTSGSTSSSSGKGSTTSNSGGATKQGSGVQPSYGGGRYYGGGSTSPYRSGLASPLGIPAVLLIGGGLAFYPGFWAYGAYGYNYHNPYAFRNRSANSTSNRSTRDIWISTLVERQDTGVNQTKPVTCLCAAYSECGCDDNGNTTFLDSLIGTGDYNLLNKSVVNVADINGTSTIVLNGTLPNGTTTSGGTEDASGAQRMLEASGYWVMIGLVGCTVLLV